MSFLAYSELLKRITGINESDLEKPFIILNRNNTTKNRLKVLKQLARIETGTIGKVLKLSKQNKSGGSYLTIKKYFIALEKEGLLKKHKQGNKEIWSFSEKYIEIKKFIQQ